MERVRFFVGSFVSLCLLGALSFAQANRVVPVCVTTMDGSAVGLSSAAARDKLVKNLSHVKDKKAQLSLQGTPLGAGTTEQVLADAKQKNCDFVVQTNLTESHEEGSMSGKATIYAGAMQNIPVYSAAVEYKVLRVSDGTTVGSGVGKATDIGSAAEVTSQALDHVATKAFADIKKTAVPVS